jgi:hypothetical protein
MTLTPQGSQTIEELARRYFVSVDAVMTLLQAVINGGGSMAQFSHPEFSGSGQWMQGGMTMVGDMFNNALKTKVDQLCSELAILATTQTLFAPPAPGQQPGNASLSVAATGSGWWPADLGTPSSTGSQNNVRYAVFPSMQRLVIEINGQIAVYDTMNHQIGGVSQQQGSDASVTFTSQFGLVRVSDLPVIPYHDAHQCQSGKPRHRRQPSGNGPMTKVTCLPRLSTWLSSGRKEFCPKKNLPVRRPNCWTACEPRPTKA